MELYNKPTEKNTCLCVESTTIWVTPTEFNGTVTCGEI